MDYHPYRVRTLISFEALTEELLLKARVCYYLGSFFHLAKKIFISQRMEENIEDSFLVFHGQDISQLVRDENQWPFTHMQTHTHTNFVH